MLKNRTFTWLVFIVVLIPACCFAQAQKAGAKQEHPRALPAPSQDYVYDKAGKRDPFIPLINADGRYVQLERTQEETEDSALKLEGIIYDKYGLSYAIVDGAVVKIGDLIADYQVLTIEEKKVVFIREGQMKEVYLQKED